MFPCPKLQVDVNSDHSCNWRCCWGCRCVPGLEDEDKPHIIVLNDENKHTSPKSETEIMETTTKVTKVVHRHGIKSAPATPNVTPREEKE